MSLMNGNVYCLYVNLTQFNGNPKINIYAKMFILNNINRLRGHKLVSSLGLFANYPSVMKWQ